MFVFTSIGFIIISLLVNWILLKIFKPTYHVNYIKYSYITCATISVSFPIIFLYNHLTEKYPSPFNFNVALLWILIAISLFGTQFIFNNKLKK